MKKSILIISIIYSINSNAQLRNHNDSVSYAAGVNMVENLRKAGINELNETVLLDAIKAHLSGNSKMDTQTAAKLYQEEIKRIADQKAKANKKAGEDFLAANKKKSGVQTTSTGLQYLNTSPGSGAQPDNNDKVTVHYHGTLIDGTVFDSSVERGQPASFGLNQVIPGWTEGLQLMKEGGKTTFYIPSELAYGARATGKIQAHSALIFEVELIKVEAIENTGTKK
ncbi:MAG: FKBP-type peptidyl-prolyl cis-trans isomerase [Flavobacteriales bacterium]